MRRIINAFFIFLLCGCLSLNRDAFAADVLCVKRTPALVVNSRIILAARSIRRVNGSCPAGFTRMVTDARTALYGDGTNGPLNVTTNSALSATHGQYQDITITSGVELTVPSGTVLRCNGTFTNNGTITVDTFAGGGEVQVASLSDSSRSANIRAAHPGIARTAGGNGEVARDTALVLGAPAGLAMSELQASNIFNPGPAGGSGGGVGGTSGGEGGGTLKILSQGAIVNNGTIRAKGETGADGGGGGGGGVLILASAGSITNESAGALEVSGGDGGTSSAVSGPGGGGGGGIVHFISPSIALLGTVTVSAGTAGAIGVSTSDDMHIGGGGGGSSGGAGGSGGSVSAAGSPGVASAGTSGYVLQTVSDPGLIFE